MGMSKSSCSAAIPLALLAALVVPGLGADEPYLVRDIYPGSGSQLGSEPFLFAAADLVFAVVTDTDHGRELWITDGTAPGTRLIRDICPGPCWSEPVPLGALGEHLLFSARPTPEIAYQLWISDGTWAGTRTLPAPGASPVGAIENRGLFFFEAEHDDLIGLWVTDGTSAGTRPVGIGGPDGWPLFPFAGSARGGILFFAAFTEEHGFVPWVTDGSIQGTRRLGDLDTGRSNTFHDPSFRHLPAGTVFFTRAQQEPCETTLWRSDGTPGGTVAVRTFDDPDCQGRVVENPVVQTGGVIYFIAQEGDLPSQLWRSDGTAGGTRAVTSFSEEAIDQAGFYRDRIAASDGAVLFVADDGSAGVEPWIADAGGARRHADLCPGTCSSRPDKIRVVDGRFFFHADDGIHGDELFVSDGTAAGTALVHDACPGGCDARPIVHGAVGERVFFTTAVLDSDLWSVARDGTGAVRLTDFAEKDPFGNPFVVFSGSPLDDWFLFEANDSEHGSELWRSDGTPAGTELVIDVETRSGLGAGSNPAGLTPWGERVIFYAREPDLGHQPWVSDGTEAGTRRLGVVAEPHVNRPSEDHYSKPLILGDDALFITTFTSHDSGQMTLWRASPEGAPVRLFELPGTGHLGSLREATRLGDRAVFLVQGSNDGDGGVWISDGTTAGTKKLGRISIRNFSFGRYTGELAGRLYFSASTGPESDDRELWRTDGTEAGTVRVADIAPGPAASRPSDFAALPGRLLFAATTDAEGAELWATDGTAAGTRLVADLIPGDRGSFPRRLTAVDGRVFFFADSGVGPEELWVTDGIAAGTRRLAEVPGIIFNASAGPTWTAANGRFFFTFAPFNGRDPQELWVSDGTVAGTGSLRPLLPPNSSAGSVWSAGDRVRVSLRVPGPFGTSYELWETDGTLAGTRGLVSLSSLGSEVHPIDDVAQAGPLLFFEGPHPQAGNELMALRLGLPEPCAPDAQTLCLGGGRFAVRVRWRDPRTGDEGVGGALPFPGSDRTGMFWFFHPDNVELVVKNLDGGPVNGWFWNFYGALSDVEYRIEVVDTATGRRVEYHNPEGHICGRGDTTAFLSREPVPLPVPPQMAAPAIAASPAPGTGSACGGGPGALCLLDSRFRVEVAWTDQRSGDSGIGTAVAGTDRSGFFWFFNQSNIELVVKMLDGRQVNGRFWVFYGALSDVAYTITVTDTETGTHKEYRNPPGEICGRGDTAAF